MVQKRYPCGLMSDHLHISRVQLRCYGNTVPRLNKQYVLTSAGGRYIISALCKIG